MKPQIIVIGGGPAGLTAAGRAARAGARSILIEKMDQPGRKLRMTGGGRCNFTNTAPLSEFIAHFGHDGQFLYQPFSRFFAAELVAFLDSLGIPARTEDEGRVFPANGRAQEVLNALLNWGRTCGVLLKTNTRVKSLLIESGKVVGVRVVKSSEPVPVSESDGQLESPPSELMPADAVIVATGGASYPVTGSTGDGYRLARFAGHTILPVRPALVPLVTAGPIASRLQGVSLKGVDVLLLIDGKKDARKTGEMLFTHFGVSGPAILSLSRRCVDALCLRQDVSLSIDLEPEKNESELDGYLLRELDSHGKQQFSTLLNRLLPRKLVPVCSELTNISANKPAHQITGSERKRLCAWLKDFRLQVTGHKSFREAMITAGGVDLREIDPRTMASRLVKGLYLAGEVLNLDADTGGYNLQAAFSTGWVAGEASVLNSQK
jgi:predicted Rossmann fold flavoprotein